MFDVCFDEEFMGGLSLGGRCSSRRGYKVPACSIINLTHGERQLNVGKHRPVAVVKPVHQQMISSTSHNLSSHKSVRRGMEPSAPHGRNNFSPPRSLSRESNTHHQTSTHGSHHQRPLSALRRNSQKPPRFQALSKAKPAQDPVSSETNGDVETSSSSHPKFRVDHKSNATSVYVDGKMKKLSDELKHVLKVGTSRNHPQPCRGFFMTQQPRVHASSKRADGRRANFTLRSRQVATSRGSSSSRHPHGSTPFARKEGTDKLWESLAAEANARNCLNETAKSKTAEASPEVDGSKFDDAPAEDANTVEELKEEKQQLVGEQKGSEDDETCAVDDVRSTSVEDCVAPASSSQHDGDTEGGLHVDELMKWCRARGMFPPIYTYSDALQEVGKYTSTVQLWNGLSFSSTPQPTRRQATETAAAFAIAHLARNVVSSNPISTPHPSGLTHCRQPPPAVPPFIFPDGMKIQGREYFHTPPMPMHHSSVGFQFPHAVFPHSPLTTRMRGTEFGVLPPAQLLAYVPPYMGSHHGPYYPPAVHNHHQPPHHVLPQHLPLYGYHQPFAFPASPSSPLQPADGFVTGGRPPHQFACTFIPSQVLRQQALAHHVRANFLLSDHPAVTSSPECDVVTSSSRDHSAAPAAGHQPVTSCAQPVTSSPSASTTSKNEGACAKWTSGGKTRPKLAISFANN